MLLVRSKLILTKRSRADCDYPSNAWKVIRFDDFGAIELIDTAPGNSGEGELSQTLLILPSLLFPSGPPENFLTCLNAAGHRVICVRRRGFGLTTSGNSWEHEVELIGRLIDHLNLQHIRCLALGSAAPLALRLYELYEPIRRVDFVNLASSAVPDNAIQNKWLKQMVAQSIVGAAGAHMVVGAIKWHLRRKGPLDLAKLLYSPSTIDVDFLEENQNIMWDAASCLSGVNPKCIRDEIVAAFVRNHEPVSIEGKSGFSIFSGPDVPDVFKTNALEFSKKCGAELREFSKGYILSIYLCAEEYADFVRNDGNLSPEKNVPDLNIKCVSN